MLARLRHDERGVALVLALLVIFVVMLLSIAVMDLAIHNSTTSAVNRKRVQSVAAAEAGLDRSFSFLEQATPAQIAASGCGATETVDSAPGMASFSTTLTFFDGQGVEIPCALVASQTPAAALIRSTGTVNGTVPRTMESYVRLIEVHGAFEAAIVSDVGLTLTNNFTLNGYQGEDADIIVNSANASLSNNLTVHGSLYVAAGSATISNNASIRKRAWANGTVLVQNGAEVLSDVASSTSSITVTNNAHVGGNATAGTTISVTNSGSIGGTQTSNSPSGPPAGTPFPRITSDLTPWVAAGYTVQSYTSCTTARTALANRTQTGNVVIRIAAVCQLSLTNNTQVGFDGDLAIITDGSIRSANNVKWNGVGGTRRLFLISAHRSALTCSGGSYDVTDTNNVSYNGAEVLFYSPCTVSISNNTGFSGQILAGTAAINNNFTMNYRPVVVPGAGISGFEEDLAYIREVI